MNKKNIFIAPPQTSTEHWLLQYCLAYFEQHQFMAAAPGCCYHIILRNPNIPEGYWYLSNELPNAFYTNNWIQLTAAEFIIQFSNFMRTPIK